MFDLGVILKQQQFMSTIWAGRMSQFLSRSPRESCQWWIIFIGLSYHAESFCFINLSTVCYLVDVLEQFMCTSHKNLIDYTKHHTCIFICNNNIWSCVVYLYYLSIDWHQCVYHAAAELNTDTIPLWLPVVHLLQASDVLILDMYNLTFYFSDPFTWGRLRIGAFVLSLSELISDYQFTNQITPARKETFSHFILYLHCPKKMAPSFVHSI